MKFGLVIILVLSSILYGCGGQSGGIAPSNEATEEPITSLPEDDGDNFMKIGEIAETSGGWEVAMSTTDPVENVTLVNGWEVEVRHE